MRWRTSNCSLNSPDNRVPIFASLHVHLTKAIPTSNLNMSRVATLHCSMCSCKWRGTFGPGFGFRFDRSSVVRACVMIIHVVGTAGAGGADNLGNELGHFHLDFEFEKVADGVE